MCFSYPELEIYGLEKFGRQRVLKEMSGVRVRRNKTINYELGVLVRKTKMINHYFSNRVVPPVNFLV